MRKIRRLYLLGFLTYWTLRLQRLHFIRGQSKMIPRTRLSRWLLADARSPLKRDWHRTLCQAIFCYTLGGEMPPDNVVDFVALVEPYIGPTEQRLIDEKMEEWINERNSVGQQEKRDQ